MLTEASTAHDKFSILLQTRTGCVFPQPAPRSDKTDHLKSARLQCTKRLWGPSIRGRPYTTLTFFGYF